MFNQSFAFNRDISGWDTSQVTNMGGMFRKFASMGTSLGGTPPK